MCKIDVMSHLVENCRDQNGSRLIQQQFEKSNEHEKEQIFAEILPHAYNLMTDVFGNYVIQKFLELGPIDQKLRLFETTKGHIYELSKHTYGCRVVQRTLEVLSSFEFKMNMIKRSSEATDLFKIMFYKKLVEMWSL